MPRRTSTKPALSTTPTSLKRRSDDTKTPTTTPRSSKRLKSLPTSKTTTPKKSQYFSHPPSSSEPETEIANEDSGYEDEDASVSAVSSPPESEEDEDEDEYVSEDNARPAKRKSGRPSSGAVAKAGKGQELWRPGVKTGLGPGKQVFIQLPKAREEGKIKYADERIHPNTMLFLGDLKENNDREWLKVHDADYRQSKKDFDSFVESLTEKIMEKDETIPELPPKDVTFRIYRDIRFSPDPTPYKTYFSAAWSRTGRKGPYAAYYLQIAPSSSFLGGGIWHPEAAPLSLLRQDLDRNSHKLKRVLLEPKMRTEFLGGVSTDVNKIVKAFVGQNTENMLKTKPKGYDTTNPNLPLLRLRNYTIGRRLADAEVVGPGALEKIADLVGVLMPFITYLNSVVMPDEVSSADEDAEVSEGEEEEEEAASEEEESGKEAAGLEDDDGDDDDADDDDEAVEDESV